MSVLAATILAASGTDAEGVGDAGAVQYAVSVHADGGDFRVDGLAYMPWRQHKVVAAPPRSPAVVTMVGGVVRLVVIQDSIATGCEGAAP